MAYDSSHVKGGHCEVLIYRRQASQVTLETTIDLHAVTDKIYDILIIKDE